jgi:hypothetical protein
MQKSEIRSLKSETNPKFKSRKCSKPGAAAVLSIAHLDFEFVSGFGFGSSDLPSHA